MKYGVIDWAGWGMVPVPFSSPELGEIELAHFLDHAEREYHYCSLSESQPMLGTTKAIVKLITLSNREAFHCLSHMRQFLMPGGTERRFVGLTDTCLPNILPLAH